MEALEAVYSGFSAGIAADSGSGGLSNATGDQYVREVVRETDRRESATHNRPAVIVGVQASEMGHEASGRSFQSVIRAMVVTDRDRGVTEEDAVVDRLVNVFNGVALGSGSTGWTFSTCTFLRTVQVQDGKLLRPVVEFQVIATK